MNLPTEVFGNVVVVHAPETLGSDQSEAFEACLASLEASNVVFDLDATEAIDSTGLAALLNVQDQMREALGDAKIATANPTNRKILEITRLDQQFEVFDNIVGAVRSFR